MGRTVIISLLSLSTKYMSILLQNLTPTFILKFTIVATSGHVQSPHHVQPGSAAQGSLMMLISPTAQMWCDQAKSVWGRSNSVFIFLTNSMHHFHSYILQKTPLKLVNWFQRYEQFKDTKNNMKQKTFSALFGSILKSIFPTSDWFCLITAQMFTTCVFTPHTTTNSLCKSKCNQANWLIC